MTTNRLLLAALLAAALGVLCGIGSAGAASGRPTLVVTPASTKAGETVRVDGAGWQPGTNVKLEICGNNALDGTADCDQTSSRIVRTFTTGRLEALLAVAAPPRPCPCIVRATELQGKTSVSTSIVIDGVPSAPPSSEAPLDQGGPTLRVTDARVEGATTLSGLVGGSAPQTLVLRVRNTADFPVNDALLSASWRKGDGTGHVIRSRRIASLPAGASRTVRLPFELGALSIGSYSVTGSVGLVGNRVNFATETSQYPWVLLAVLLGIVVLMVLLIVRAVRRRRARRRAVEAAQLKAARAEKNGDGWNTKKNSPKARRAAKAGKDAATGRESELVP